MPPLSAKDRASARAIAELGYCNPFTPERIQLEREVLQDAFVWTDDAWHKRVDARGAPPNIDLMTERARELAEKMRVCGSASAQSKPPLSSPRTTAEVARPAFHHDLE